MIYIFIFINAKKMHFMLILVMVLTEVNNSFSSKFYKILVENSNFHTHFFIILTVCIDSYEYPNECITWAKLHYCMK